MAYNSDSEPHKRKRDIADDNGGQSSHADRIPQPPPPQSGNQIPINYLSKAQGVKLKLIQGDADTFSDVLTLINEYEGVLNRHESLASNLGAKLTGPRLLKAMEGVFEGPITTTPPQTMFTPDPVTWLDIVEFAKSNPNDFNLTTSPGGFRCCTFPLKRAQVDISEDDWRLIKSGALDRFPLVPPQPLEEDETAEMVTLEILEQRLQVLIKKADEVARRARQLNYHLSGRKASIGGRRASPAPGNGPGFQTVNPQGRPSNTNAGYDLHSDLLQQFLAPPQHPGGQRLSSAGSVPPTPPTLGTTSSTSKASSMHQQHQPQSTLVQPPQQLQQPQQPTISSSNRPSPVFHGETGLRDYEEENRALVTAKIEKLSRGDIISPPCDRCRRLKTHCVKHLTACQGCTKKHARCVWKGLTEEEVAGLKGELAAGDGDRPDEDLADDGCDDSHDVGRGFGSPRGDSDDRRRLLERHEDSLSGNMSSRIALGRHADDIWRKGPNLPIGHRLDTMDIDPRDTAGVPYEQMQQHHGDHTRLSHMASIASAAAEASSATSGSRGSLPRIT